MYNVELVSVKVKARSRENLTYEVRMPCYNKKTKTGIKTVRQLCEWLFCISCLFLSFYERKYKVFLRLFAHQREYQALMNQRWRCLWEAAVLVPTLSGVIVMTNPRTGNKNRSPNLAAFTYIITGPVFVFCFFNIHFLNSSLRVEYLSGDMTAAIILTPHMQDFKRPGRRQQRTPLCRQDVGSFCGFPASTSAAPPRMTRRTQEWMWGFHSLEAPQLHPQSATTIKYRHTRTCS